MTQKMVLFDWSGTLINDTFIWRKSTSRIFELYDMEPPSTGEYFQRLAKLKDRVKVYQSFGINLKGEELDKIYLAEYQKHCDEIELSPGAKETLEILKNQGVILGIITAELGSLFDPLFSRFLLKKYFSEVVTDAQKKNVCIVHLCRRQKIKFQDCYYIGDAPSDIRHAKNAGVKSIAYLAEHIPHELLLAAGPDFTISHLKEIPKIVNK